MIVDYPATLQGRDRASSAAALVPPPAFADGPEEVGGSNEAPPDQRQALLGVLRRLQNDELEAETAKRTLVDCAVGLLGADLGWISEANAAGDFEITYHCGLRNAGAVPAHQSLGGYGAEAVRRRRTLVVLRFGAGAQTPEQPRRQLLAEGLRSLICAPLFVGDELLGILCAGRRSETPFQRHDSVVFGTLAAQGAITIRNGRLFERVEANADRLRRAVAVNRRLHQALLAGAGVSGVAAVLATALERPVGISRAGEDGAALWHGRDGEICQRPAGEAGVTVPIASGPEVLGAIEVLGAAELTVLQRQFVAHGATVLAAELTSQGVAQDTEWRLQGELLEELVSTSAPLPRSLALRAKRLGADLASLGPVLALSRGEDAGASSLLIDVRRAAGGQLRDSSRRMLAFDRGDSVVIALPESDRCRATVRGIEKSLRRSGPILIGVGHGRDPRSALLAADVCLALARRQPEGGAVFSEDLGPFRSLIGSAEHRHATEFVREVLRPVHEADEEGRIPLLETLSAYVEADGNRDRTAALCFVHPSTLRYRLKRLREVVAIDDPVRLLELQTALGVLRLLTALGEDPLGTG